MRTFEESHTFACRTAGKLRLDACKIRGMGAFYSFGRSLKMHSERIPRRLVGAKRRSRASRTAGLASEYKINSIPYIWRFPASLSERSEDLSASAGSRFSGAAGSFNAIFENRAPWPIHYFRLGSFFMK
jgi:hypothetical protein